MNEIIYVAINKAMPGYVKIGRTTDLEKRLLALDNTSIPVPFEFFYACTVKDANFAEKQLHDAFLEQRARPNREFFEVSPDRVVAALKLAEIENITPKKDYPASPADQQALNRARSRRSVFNFAMVNILPGAELTFVNDENIIAKVIDKRRIELNGEITSPSAAAQKLLGYQYQVQGTIYWRYEGETLDERRQRLENED